MERRNFTNRAGKDIEEGVRKRLGPFCIAAAPLPNFQTGPPTG
jgi:hypothetical protein